MNPDDRRRKTRFRLLAAAGVAVFAVGNLLYHSWYRQEVRARNERSASSTLKTLATAEADFRANDRDGNRVADFWTGDVAGLWSILDPSGKPLALIDRRIAEADATPVARIAPKPVPWNGYYFAVLRVDNSTGPPVPYQVDTDGSGRKVRNTSGFGFCAYPAEYGKTGKWTFIINENNTVFRLDTNGRPPTEWPRDENWPGSYIGE